jgi:ABC-2 type transport system permease protein
MTLALVHARAHLLQLARYPAFAIPTLLLPALFYAFFGLPQRHTPANVLLASFAAYAVLSLAFFQFGVGIALDRVDPWEAYLRTLPASTRARFAGRIVSALAFALASASVVAAVAVSAGSASLSPGGWARLSLALLAGSIPLALLGIALGYWTPPKGALPIANLLYLTTAYVGGLWTGPHNLPKAVDEVGRILPTRQWGNVVWSAAGGGIGPAASWLALLAYTVVFAAVAVWGYRRDEGERFR